MVKIVLDDDESLLNFCVMTSHKLVLPTVSTRMQFLSPFHLNLVVVGAGFFVIDFDDSRVVV